MANLMTHTLRRVSMRELFRNDVKILIQSMNRNHTAANSAQPSTPNHAQQPIDDDVDIRVEQKDGVTLVEGIPVNPNAGATTINKKSTACVLCRLNINNLNYTDVLVLAQFIKRDGSLATFEESKLCNKQYFKVKTLIKKAQRCNLIRRPPDYLVPGPWHDLNTYLEPDRKRDQPMKIVKKEYWKL